MRFQLFYLLNPSGVVRHRWARDIFLNASKMTATRIICRKGPGTDPYYGIHGVRCIIVLDLMPVNSD